MGSPKPSVGVDGKRLCVDGIGSSLCGRDWSKLWICYWLNLWERDGLVKKFLSGIGQTCYGSWGIEQMFCR